MTETKSIQERYAPQNQCFDRVTATCTGTFVAVKPGHPAYHRW